MYSTFGDFFGSLTRRSRAVLLATMCGAALIPAGAIAQTNSREVAGVALGMTASQVETVLKARNPNYKFLTVFRRGADGKASADVFKFGAALPSGPTDRINTSRGYSRPEALMVYFSSTDGRAYAIYRQFVDKKVGVSANEMEAELTRKYGPTVGTKGYYRLYQRMIDAKGQPNTRCGSRGFDWETAPGVSRGCGFSVESQFSDPLGPDTYATFQTWMLDHAVTERDGLAALARQQKAQEEVNLQMQGAARANKPGL